MNTQAGLQIPKCGEWQLILREWLLTRIICQPNVDFWWTWVLHRRPPRICLLFAVRSGHMGGCWCVLCNLSKAKNCQKIHLVQTKRKTRRLTSPQMDLRGSTQVATVLDRMWHLLWGITYSRPGLTKPWPSEKSHKLVNYSSTTSASLQTNFLWAPSEWKQWYRRME